MKNLNKNEIDNVAGGLDVPAYSCKILSTGISDGGRNVYEFKLTPKEISVDVPGEEDIGKNIITELAGRFSVGGYVLTCKSDLKTY